MHDILRFISARIRVGGWRGMSNVVPSVVEHHAADHLYVVMAEPEDTPACFTNHSKGFIKDVIFGFSALQEST
jgi:hypothetical protein